MVDRGHRYHFRLDVEDYSQYLQMSSLWFIETNLAVE